MEKLSCCASDTNFTLPHENINENSVVTKSAFVFGADENVGPIVSIDQCKKLTVLLMPAGECQLDSLEHRYRTKVEKGVEKGILPL